MNLKRIKAAIAELSACVEEMEGEDEAPAADNASEEEDEDSGSSNTLKMKLMKFKTA